MLCNSAKSVIHKRDHSDKFLIAIDWTVPHVEDFKCLDQERTATRIVLDLDGGERLIFFQA